MISTPSAQVAATVHWLEGWMRPLCRVGQETGPLTGKQTCSCSTRAEPQLPLESSYGQREVVSVVIEMDVSPQLDSSRIVDGHGCNDGPAFALALTRPTHIAEPPADMRLASVFLVGGCTWTRTTPKRSAATGFRRGARRALHTESECARVLLPSLPNKTRRGSGGMGCMDELHAFFDAA